MAYKTPTIDHEERRRFLDALGVAGVQGSSDDLTLENLRPSVEPTAEGELAAMGRAIRSDLSGQLDADLLDAQLSTLCERTRQLPALAAESVPARDGTVYRRTAAPVWAVYDHLEDVSFFESLEAHLPAFNEPHIESSARELVRSEALESVLLDAGFEPNEITTVVSNVVTGRDQLALWVPTKDIPEGVEFDLEHVPPLHRRAVGGVGLWLDDIDRHLWQKEYLITDEMIVNGVWDVRTMLGGVSLLTSAARDVAADAATLDSQLVAAITAGTASAILGQEAIVTDLYRITDEMRAPRTADDQGEAGSR